VNPGGLRDGKKEKLVMEIELTMVGLVRHSLVRAQIPRQSLETYAAKLEKRPASQKERTV